MSFDKLNDSSPFVFEDIALEQRPAKLGDAWYILEEPSGGAVVNWRNGMLSSGRLGPDGTMVRVETIASIEPQLIADCIFYATVKKGVKEVKYAGDLDKGQRVPLSVVLGWPPEVYPPLYAWLMKVGNLQDLFKEAVTKGKEQLAKAGDKQQTELQTQLGNAQSS